MSNCLFKKLLVTACAFFIGGSVLFSQEGMPPPDGMGGDPNAAPVKPEKPVKPLPVPPLELDTAWLDVRTQLLGMSDAKALLEVQFKTPQSSSQLTDNPLVQQYREYFSDKRIVSEWQRQRPLGNEWVYPVPAATEAIQEIDRRLTESLVREAEETFPQKTRDAYLLEAEKLYTMCKPGQTVEFRLRRTNAGKVRGKVLEMARDRILLAPRRFVMKDDLTDETAACFFKDVHDRMVKTYADTAEQKCLLSRENFKRQQRVRRLPQLLKEKNYVQNHLDFAEEVQTKIFKLEYWISRRDLVRRQQFLQWENSFRGRNSLGERMQREFMHRMGFRQINEKESLMLGRALRTDEENRYLGWVPMSHVSQMQAWILKKEAYDKAIAEYDAKLKQYQEDLKRYEDWQKAHGGNAGDEDEDD